MVLGDRYRDDAHAEDHEKQRNDRYGAKNEGGGNPPLPDLSLGIAAQARRHGGEDDTDRIESDTSGCRSGRATNEHQSQPEKKRERVDKCPVDRAEASAPGRDALEERRQQL